MLTFNCKNCDSVLAAEKAAAEEPRATLQSPLTLTVIIVTVIVVAYAFMSVVGEGVVGAAAGAAAGVGILYLQWEEEERTGLVAVAVTGVTGGIAGIAAAMLRSMVGARSLTGAEIVGAIAGAAIVAAAKTKLQLFIKTIQHFIVALKLFLGVTLVATLFKWAMITITWVKDQIKWAVSQVKKAAQWIIEAAKTAFNTLASFGASGLAVAAAGLMAAVALASAAASGLAAVAGLASGLFGGLLGLVLVLAAGAAIFGSYWRRQSNQPQTQGGDVMLPVAALLLFVLFCFLVASVGLFRCCCLLLFLFLFLWFLLSYRSERH